MNSKVCSDHPDYDEVDWDGFLLTVCGDGPLQTGIEETFFQPLLYEVGPCSKPCRALACALQASDCHPPSLSTISQEMLMSCSPIPLNGDGSVKCDAEEESTLTVNECDTLKSLLVTQPFLDQLGSASFTLLESMGDTLMAQFVRLCAPPGNVIETMRSDFPGKVNLPASEKTEPMTSFARWLNDFSGPCGAYCRSFACALSFSGCDMGEIVDYINAEVTEACRWPDLICPPLLEATITIPTEREETSEATQHSSSRPVAESSAVSSPILSSPSFSSSSTFSSSSSSSLSSSVDSFDQSIFYIGGAGSAALLCFIVCIIFAVFIRRRRKEAGKEMGAVNAQKTPGRNRGSTCRRNSRAGTGIHRSRSSTGRQQPGSYVELRLRPQDKGYSDFPPSLPAAAASADYTAPMPPSSIQLPPLTSDYTGVPPPNYHGGKGAAWTCNHCGSSYEYEDDLNFHKIKRGHS